MEAHPVIGHVHLKVSDLERAVVFYRDVLGMEVQQRYGAAAAFLSWGGYHHHLGLNVWESRGGSPPPRNSTGLYHAAILYPHRASLARAFVTASLWMIRTSFQQQRAFAERFIRHLESSLEALRSETAFTRKAICRLTGAVRRNSQLLRKRMEKGEDDGVIRER